VPFIFHVNTSVKGATSIRFLTSRLAYLRGSFFGRYPKDGQHHRWIQTQPSAAIDDDGVPARLRGHPVVGNLKGEVHVSDPYLCAHCGHRYVVPSIARDCERRER